MMKDGGSAFPRPLSVSHGSVTDHQYSACEQDGMSLRDYFAAKAMQGLLHDTAHFDAKAELVVRAVADLAYDYADAMLKVRES
jgi:hypothetical protein